MIKAVLFDVDGVLALPKDIFSIVYTKSHGLNPEPFEKFFINEWTEFILGKRDLKQHIKENPEFWKWDGTADTLLDYWFTSEDIKNDELIAIVQQLRGNGIKCYIATEQEKYRTEYMENVMFKDKFDGIFSTCDLGLRKTETEFYAEILKKLKRDLAGIKPNEVVFFDDSDTKVQTALLAGIDARLYTSINQVRSLKVN